MYAGGNMSARDLLLANFSYQRNPAVAPWASVVRWPVVLHINIYEVRIARYQADDHARRRPETCRRCGGSVGGRWPPAIQRNA
jgi:hypothetical protein